MFLPSFCFHKKKKHTKLKVMTAIFATLGVFVSIWAFITVLFKKYHTLFSVFATEDDLGVLEDEDNADDDATEDKKGDSVTVE